MLKHMGNQEIGRHDCLSTKLAFQSLVVLVRLEMRSQMGGTGVRLWTSQHNAGMGDRGRLTGRLRLAALGTRTFGAGRAAFLQCRCLFYRCQGKRSKGWRWSRNSRRNVFCHSVIPTLLIRRVKGIRRGKMSRKEDLARRLNGIGRRRNGKNRGVLVVLALVVASVIRCVGGTATAVRTANASRMISRVN